MTTRKTKLEKALAFDDEKASNAAINGRSIIYNQETLKFREAARWENSRLAPLHAALLETVKALELYASVTEGAIGHQSAELALAKLDEALKHG